MALKLCLKMDRLEECRKFRYKSDLLIKKFSNIQAISAANNHFVFLTSDGVIHAIGTNENSDYDIPVQIDYKYQRTDVDVLNK